jgi:hypothetical protein
MRTMRLENQPYEIRGLPKRGELPGNTETKGFFALRWPVAAGRAFVYSDSSKRP